VPEGQELGDEEFNADLFLQATVCLQRADLP
jgi:hypothetical protein